MLETIRCKALNQFKEEFAKALKKRRTEFQVAVCDSTKSCMTVFDKECEDAAIRDTSNARDELQRDIDLIVASVAPIVEKREKRKTFCKRMVKVTSVAIQIGTGDVTSFLEVFGVPSVGGMIGYVVGEAMGELIGEVVGGEIANAIGETITQEVIGAAMTKVVGEGNGTESQEAEAAEVREIKGEDIGESITQDEEGSKEECEEAQVSKVKEEVTGEAITQQVIGEAIAQKLIKEENGGEIGEAKVTEVKEVIGEANTQEGSREESEKAEVAEEEEEEEGEELEKQSQKKILEKELEEIAKKQESQK